MNNAPSLFIDSSSDNGQSMVIYPLGMNHAPSVIFVSRQRSEHGNLYLRYDPYSVSCYRLVTTVVSCHHLEHGYISYGMNHARSVDIVS